MPEDTTPENDLTAEFRRLGENLRGALRAAWESEERHAVQSEIERGLHQAAGAVREAAEDLRASPAGRRLRSEMEGLEARIRSGELQAKTRDEILKALRMLNAELEKLASPGDRPPDSGTSV
jgi:hypothetical protein